MLCGKCGRNNPKNVNNCIYCGAPLQRAGAGYNIGRQQKGGHKKNDRTDIIIISLILVLVLVFLSIAGILIYKSQHKKHGFRSGSGGGGGYTASSVYTPDFDNEDAQAVLDRIAELNGGNMPEITYDNEGIPSFIDGKYSNVKVRDYRTAMQSLNDLKGLMQMENPVKEYTGLNSYDNDLHKFYKLQQVVNDVPVYGKQLIVETDTSGNIESLSCDYDPGLTGFNTKPSITKDQAGQRAREITNKEKIYLNKLYVYTSNGDPALVWSIDVGSGLTAVERILISASSGEMIERIDLARYATVEATAVDMDGQPRTIHVSQSNGTYLMKNEQYGITINECNNSENGDVVTSSDNTWNNPTAVSVMSDLEKVLDCYTNVFKSTAFRNGGLKQIDAYINVRLESDDSQPFNNVTSYTNPDDLTKTILCYGNAQSFAKCLDVTAHEFTHSVVSATCSLEYMNESGAIDEAYADIIGNLIQNHCNNTSEWDLGEDLESGAERSISNPPEYGQADNINSRYMHDYCYENHDHREAECDNGGVHTNSGVVSKAAYLMYSRGLDNKMELASLFVRSMDYMTPTSGFLECRAAVLRAARDMGMDSDKISIITGSFAEVGIVNETSSWMSLLNGILTGKVADAVTKAPIPDVEITAKRSTPGRHSTGRAYTDASGNFSVNISEGTYTLTVGASGYRSCKIENVSITKWETTYLENTILLTETAQNPLSQAGGKVTNAVSGESIEGVQLKFRSEWGNDSAEYVKNTYGNDIRLLTNSEGEYYTAELPYGYYTAEVSKEGFAAQYVNIIATNNTDVSMNQNIVLVPEASGNDFRITLEWDENPRDEDAHIVGDMPGDFHVYYRNKQAVFSDETIANLDHDDTRGNGFETITLKADDEGYYRYYVHHYAGEGTLSASNAKVKVYQGGVLIKQYNVPVDQGEGKYWHVFDISHGEIETINKITDSSER